MNKKHWTLKDIYPGLYIIKESSPFGSDNLSFARSVTYKIGYSFDSPKRYGLISCLTDGFFGSIGNSLQEVADYLNDDKTGWGYRRLTKKEYIKLINNTEQGFAKTY